MTRNLTSLYMPLVAARGLAARGLLLQAWGLAVARDFGARPVPAWEAARTQVRAVWYREELEEKLESRAGLITWAGLLCLAGAMAALLWKWARPALARVCGGLSHPPGLRPVHPLVSARRLGARPTLRKSGRGPPADLGCRYLAGSSEPQRGFHRRPGLRPGDAHRGDGDDRLLPPDR